MSALSTKRVIAVLTTVILALVSLAVVAFGVLLVVESRRLFEYALSVMVLGAGVLLAPLLNLVCRSLADRLGRKAAQPLLVFKAVVIVFRVIILVVLTAVAVAFAPKVLPQMAALVESLNPIPFAAEKYGALEALIDGGDAATAWSQVQAIPNYRKRVDLARLATRNLERTYERAVSLCGEGRGDSARTIMDASLTYFNTGDQIESVDTGAYDASPLATCMARPKLAAILVFHGSLHSRGYDQSEGNVILGLLARVDPGSPEGKRLKADNLWFTGKQIEAQRAYTDYLGRMIAMGRRDSVPSDVLEIVTVETMVTPATVALLYKWYLSSEVGYLFDSTAADGGEPVALSGRRLGRYSGDLVSLLWDASSITGYLNLLSDQPAEDGEPVLAVYSRVSGKPLYQQNHRGWHFDWVNPEIVQWASANLIPDPRAHLGDFTFQRIYDAVFRDFFRAAAILYKYETTRRDIAKDAADYADSCMRNDRDGMSYLQEVFGSVDLPRNSMDSRRIVMLMGFWLRRHVDGSIGTCWDGLSKGLRLYDNAWLSHLDADLNELAEEVDDEDEGEGYDQGQGQADVN